MAEKPAGITGGDGTSAEQAYEVHNYDELNWCCVDSTAGTTVYIKLMNDIDCQEYDIDFLFSITITHNVFFDMNNKTIKTFYIRQNSYVFNAAQYYLDIHDGKILNVYGYWDGLSSGLFYAGTSTVAGALKISNLSISANATKLYSIIATAVQNASNYTIRNCAFWITGIDRSLNSTGRLVRGNVTMTCCDFYLDDAVVSHNLFNGNVASGTAITTQSSVLSNCRFQGDLTTGNVASGNIGSGTSLRYYYVIGAHTVFRNCVWDINITNTIAPTTQYLVQLTSVASTSNSGLYNVDKWADTVTMPGGYIAAHTNEMDMRENPNADIVLQGMGFDVLKG